MKKSSIHIILLAFVGLSFSIFNVFPSAKSITAVAVEKPITVLDQNSNSTDSEIEHCTAFINSFAQAQHGFVKGNDYINAHGNSIVPVNLTASTNSFSYIELYSNNYLEHNYPSHNFW